jgi:hypothetical protein
MDPDLERKKRDEINAPKSWMFFPVGWKALLFDLRITL